MNLTRRIKYLIMSAATKNKFLISSLSFLIIILFSPISFAEIIRIECNYKSGQKWDELDVDIVGKKVRIISIDRSASGVIITEDKITFYFHSRTIEETYFYEMWAIDRHSGLAGSNTRMYNKNGKFLKSWENEIKYCKKIPRKRQF